MRVLFAASPAIAIPSMLALHREGLLCGLLTNPKSPKGRGSGNKSAQLLPTDAAEALLQLDQHIPVIEAATLDAEARHLVSQLEPDILVSFAYGRYFGPRFLELFPLGGINIHPSLLPRHRGPSPIPASIRCRDTETGLCIQRIAAEVDSGTILASTRLPLTGSETTSTLSETFAQLAPDILIRCLASIAAGHPQEAAQEGSPSYTRVITGKDRCVDWSASALDIDAHIRAMRDAPLAVTTMGTKTLLIHKASVYSQGQVESPVPASAQDFGHIQQEAQKAEYPEAHASEAPGTMPASVYSQGQVESPVPATAQDFVHIQQEAQKAESTKSHASEAAGTMPASVYSQGQVESPVPASAQDFGHIQQEAQKTECPEAHAPEAPGTVLGVDKRAGILVRTGCGVIALQIVQIETRKPLPFAEFAHGFKGLEGIVLGADSDQ